MEPASHARREWENLPAAEQDLMKCPRLILLVAAATVALATLAASPGLAAPAVHVGSDWRKTSVGACLRRAVLAMGRDQNFIHAKAEGSVAWGYDERNNAFVHCLPERDGVWITVVVAGTNDAEAARLRNDIRTRVFDGADDPRAPAEIDRRDSGRAGPTPAVYWGTFDKQTTAGGFATAASQGMAFQGLQTQTLNRNTLVFGTSRDAVVVAYCLPGPQRCRVGVVAAAADRGLADRLRKQVQSHVARSVIID
jgi:hypothetical protein